MEITQITPLDFLIYFQENLILCIYLFYKQFTSW